MKNRFFLRVLFGLTVLLMNLSCSQDNNSDEFFPIVEGKASAITAGVAGNGKNFAYIQLSPVSGDSGNTLVTASVSENATEKITFKVIGNTTGALAIYDLELLEDEITYEQNLAINFTTNVTVNNSDVIEGTFTGTLISAADEEIVVSNGAFKVYR